MITLITGTPGSGKTLFAVSKILEYVEQNKQLLKDGKEPRLIYADIDGLTIEGIEPAPKDWRDTPDGSVIFYDEIQQRDEYKKSRYDNEICDALQVHRHTGHDIYGITQFPVLLHPNFRAVVGMHHHLHRGWGLASATVFNWAYCVDAPNAPSNKKLAEHTFRFNYDKSIYKHYKSATIHTHKARIPKRMFLIFFVVLVLGYFAYNLLFNKNNYFKTLYGIENKEKTKQTKQDSPIVNLSAEQPNQPSQPNNQTLTQEQFDNDHEYKIKNRRIYLYEQNLPPDYQIRRTDPALQVLGVVKMKNKCLAYNAYGDVMTLSHQECLSYVNTGKVYRSDFQNSPIQGDLTPQATPAPTQENKPQTPNFHKIDKAPIVSTSEYIHRSAGVDSQSN